MLMTRKAQKQYGFDVYAEDHFIHFLILRID